MITCRLVSRRNRSTLFLNSSGMNHFHFNRAANGGKAKGCQTIWFVDSSRGSKANVFCPFSSFEPSRCVLIEENCCLKMCTQVYKWTTNPVIALRCFDVCGVPLNCLGETLLVNFIGMPEFFIAGTCGLVPLQNTCSCKRDWPADRGWILPVGAADAFIRNL